MKGNTKKANTVNREYSKMLQGEGKEAEVIDRC